MYAVRRGYGRSAAMGRSDRTTSNVPNESCAVTKINTRERETLPAVYDGPVMLAGK